MYVSKSVESLEKLKDNKYKLQAAISVHVYVGLYVPMYVYMDE